MKLLRFELAAAPGYTRSGIVYGGKVYETDGANAIGVHEWQDVVPFIPTGQPPSYRVFRPRRIDEPWLQDSENRPLHSYLNPASLLAPSRALPKPPLVDKLGFEPQLAVVVAAAGLNVSVDEADGFALGITIANTFFDMDIDAQEREQHIGPGRSRDFATAVGPFLTTPEELDDIVIDDSHGRRYKLEVIVRVNGDEVGREDLGALPHTLAELTAFASETCTLSPGDLIGYGPVGIRKPITLVPNDEVQVTVERLGSLVTRIT